VSSKDSLEFKLDCRHASVPAVPVRLTSFASTATSDAAKPKPAGQPAKPPGRIDDVHQLRWIALAGGMLCMNSGWVNAVAFRGFDGGVTHVTGTSTAVALNLATGEPEEFLRSTAKILAFMCGAIISGGYLGRSRLFKGGPRYAHLLILVSAALAAACGAEMAGYNFAGALLLAVSSGVQNALTTLYSGAVLRTTHVTGTVTDMGVEIGMILFQMDLSGSWKLKVYFCLLLAYIGGGFLGAVCFNPSAISGPDFVRAEAQAVLVPAAVTLAMAVSWLASLRCAEPDPRGCGLHAEVTWRQPAGEEPKLERRNSVLVRGFR
jgi:uncharacterized membrane protein YoaK (UPF0700 family)